MKKWKAPKGRFERIIVFYIGLAFLSFLNIRLTMILSVLVIPITLKKLLSSKLPEEIHINKQQHVLRVKLSGNWVELHFEELAYAVSLHDHHIGLSLYKTLVGTRGQLVKKKITEIIGVKWTTSWKMNQVQEICDVLNQSDIIKVSAENRDLTLWDRIISN